MPAHVAPAGDVESPGHAVQDPPPDASLYVPASHAVHGPPLGPVYPAMHSQSPLASLPAGDVELAGHAVHEREIGVYWYLFSNHYTRKCIHKK